MKVLYAEALESICNTEDVRAFAKAPFLIGDLAYATDGFLLARIKADKVIDSKEFRSEEDLDFSKVIPTEETGTIRIPLEDIKEAFKLGPQVELYDTKVTKEECETCEGKKKVTWQYDDYLEDFDCPVCKGVGSITTTEQVKNGKTGIDRTAYVLIGKSYFFTNLILKLIDVIEKVGGDEIKLISQPELGGSLFHVKDLDIVLMPCIRPSDGEIVATY